MKTCLSCFVEYGDLADYCGQCGSKLPEVEPSDELQEDKDQHNMIICKSAFGHVFQLSLEDDPRFCTACGGHLPVMQ